MTVPTQVIESLANAKGLQANFETFALQTEDEQAKAMYEQAARELNAVIQGLEERMKEIQQEEPQFRNQ